MPTPYRASDARADYSGNQKAAEREGNYRLIKQVANSNGRWVYVNFGHHGIHDMKRILEADGYRTEITHDGCGLRASW